ncbi:hypothetical protein DE4585_01620 [Mycobacteroides salmoniphilum]|uniref:Uncharacterized protein n=1 Tax=Mycobacteroides salmoniphilum TaxID=404941 RepID=A0A4R8S3R0_9MYCO|nr:hypothetical protein DE4585_01620 [Mycobacteroides salmoniphilum]
MEPWSRPAGDIQPQGAAEGTPLDYPEPRPPRRAPWIVLSAFLGILVVGLVVAVVAVGSQRSIAGMAIMAPGEPPVTPSRTSVPPGSTPGAIPAPNGSQGPLGGATYRPGEKLQPISMPTYIPFNFNLPGGWGCMHTENKPLDNRITCMDEANKGGAAGWIGSSRCADGCGQLMQNKVRAKLPVDAKSWKPIDDVTSYARMTGTLGNGMRVVRIAMTCAFASTPGGSRDTLAVAMLTGPPETEDTLQKIANELRSRVPA